MPLIGAFLFVWCSIIEYKMSFLEFTLLRVRSCKTFYLQQRSNSLEKVKATDKSESLPVDLCIRCAVAPATDGKNVFLSVYDKTLVRQLTSSG